MTTDTMADMVNTNGVQNRLLGALYPILVLFGAYSWLFYKSKVVYLYDIILLKIILLKQFFVYIHDHLISAIGSQKYHACFAYSTYLLFSTPLTMASWSPISHPGLVSTALFSAGSSHICHLVASVSNVKVTCLPGTHPPVVSPKALFLVHYSSSCTPLLSVPSFPLVP